MTLHNTPHSPLMDNCPQSLPASAYFDADWFMREKQAIWGSGWIYVGRLNDLPHGTMRRLDLAGINVVLCRDASGIVTAFHNTCRHRGAELCQHDEKPLGKLINCPYHAWAYSTAGRLISTGHGTPTADFRKEDHGLFPLHVKNWNGFVYLCLADAAPELTDDETVLDDWPMQSLVTGHRLVKDLACNWKLFWENYNECLHCPGVHPELCDMVPHYKQGIMAPNEAPTWIAGSQSGPLLKSGASSWTTSGASCGPEFPNLTPDQRAAGHHYVTIYPTMFVVAHVDYVRCVSLTPTGPETTRLTAEWLFAEETLAQPSFDAAEVARFSTTVILQDCEVAEINQRGLKSPKFRHGRLMPQEFAIHNFHRWLAERMANAAN